MSTISLQAADQGEGRRRLARSALPAASEVFAHFSVFPMPRRQSGRYAGRLLNPPRSGLACGRPIRFGNRCMQTPIPSPIWFFRGPRKARTVSTSVSGSTGEIGHGAPAGDGVDSRGRLLFGLWRRAAAQRLGAGVEGRAGGDDQLPVGRAGISGASGIDGGIGAQGVGQLRADGSGRRAAVGA